MAKKVLVNQEYLENKLKALVEQRDKVEKVLEQYNELWIKLSGAIEVTESMIEDFKPIEEVKEDESK